MNLKVVFNKILPTLCMASGLVGMGWFVYAGLRHIADRDRQLFVRGLAEREVMADKVTWPLVVKTLGDDLPRLYEEVNANNAVVVAFLKANGIDETEISLGAPVVYDNDAQTYRTDLPYRYNVTSVITVTSAQVEKVNGLIKRQVELLKGGVALSNDYAYQTVYEYTGLNDIKPDMIAEATRNAREAAAKFAEDAGGRIGGIKSGSQGQFSITDRDAFTPWIKKIRVVTTVTYDIKRR